MPEKWRRIKSGDERDSQSYDEDYRLKKVAPYGWDGVNMTQTKVNSDGQLSTIDGMEIPTHDFVELSYTGSDLTGVVYKTGGSGGTTVGTLTLTYSATGLTGIALT